MPSTYSYDPLQRPPSLDDDDQLTPTDGYFGSRQHSQDQYVEASVTTQQSVESNMADRLYSPALSEAEWGADTGSMYAEGHPLLRDHSPPPNYERVDPIYATRQTIAGDQSNSGSTLLFGMSKVLVPSSHDDLRRSLIDVDTEPRHWDRFSNLYSRSGRREERCQKFREFRDRLPKAILVLAGFALFGLAAAVIIRGKGILGWVSVCLAKDFVSRDYQIQSLEHFDFSDTDKQNSGLPRGFLGVMHILSGPSDQAVDLNVSIRSTASDLRVGKIDAEWRPSSLISCAEVALYFRPGLEISNLRIASKNLKLVLSSDLIVTETTTISLNKGNLVSKNFGSSRETYINVRESAVSGTFSLCDVLSIKIRSGSVSVDIDPKAVLNGLPKPAVLEVESRSGVIDINYPANKADIPNRQYRSTITSRSGSVNAKILHGQETTIKIRSGNVEAQILPYGGDQGYSSLITTMESGSSRIELLEPYSQHENPFARMSSSHSARSGNLQLKYPDEWQGSIYGNSRSGSLTVRGRDVEIIRQGSKGGSKYIEARKGYAGSKLKFDIRSGNVDAAIGA